MRLVVLSLLFAACDQEEPGTLLDPIPTPTPAPLCGDFATEDGDGCAATLSVDTCNPLPDPRDHLGVALVEAEGASYLIATGGLDFGAAGVEANRAHDGIYSAEVLEDGSLGPWTAAVLPEARAGHGIAAFEGRVYLIGGFLDFGAASGPALETWTNRVISGVFSVGTGTLEDVREEAPIPESIWHIQATTFQGELLAIGGRTAGGQASTMSVRAVFDGNAITGWEPYELTLERARTHHGLATQGDQIFLAGGLNDSGAMSAVMRADTANPGPFERVYDLETARLTAATFVIGDVLYVGAGLTSNSSADSVEVFPVGDSSDRTWDVTVPTLPLGVGHIHQVPVLGNTGFLVGGRTLSGSSAQCVLLRQE